MKELLIYFYISAFMVEEFINGLEENKNSTVRVRFNSPGGDVFRGYGAITKLKEHKKRKEAIVDGYAASMAGVMLPFFDKVTVTNVSFIMIHRATASNTDDPGRRKMLDKVNQDIYNALSAKIDEDKFEEIAEVSLEDIFFTDGFEEHDVWLTGEEAESIGLADEIVYITEESAENAENLDKDFAVVNKNILFLNHKGGKPTNRNTPKSKKEEPKNTKMDKAELKAKHPETYNEIYNEGVESGTKEERDRAGAYANFISSDPEKVKKAIQEGEEFNNTVMSELAQTAIQKGAAANLETDSPEDEGEEGAENKDKGTKKDKKEKSKSTPAASSEDESEESEEKDEKAESLNSFEEEVKANLGIGKKD